MQSILQYRRFKRTLEVQLERDQAKADALRRGQYTSNQPDSPTPASVDEEKKSFEQDIERADFTNTASHATRPAGASSQVGAHPATSSEKEDRRRQEPAEEPEEEEEEEDDDDDYMLYANRTLSRTTTHHSTGTALGTVLTGIQIRKRTTREGGDGHVFVVAGMKERTTHRIRTIGRFRSAYDAPSWLQASVVSSVLLLLSIAVLCLKPLQSSALLR